MAENKTVKILRRVADPTDRPEAGASRAILAPGATVTVPEVWADRWLADGTAEESKVKKSEK